MRIAQILAAVLAVALLVVLVAGPIGPVPGVFIGGEATAAPATWPDTAAIDEIRLKVPGVIPRVVIIWVIDVEGELYVLGMKSSGWVSRIGAGGPVEVRIDDRTYPVRAVTVDDGAEAVYRAYLAKYEPNYPELVESFPSIEEGRELASIYRLDRDVGR